MAFQFTTPLRWARMNHIKPKKFWVEPGDVLGETQIGSVPGQEVGLWDVRLSDNQMNKLSQKETRAFHHGNRRVSLQPSGAAAKALTRATAPRLPFGPPHSGRGNPRQPSWRAKRKADDKAKWMRTFVAGLEKLGVNAHRYADFNWYSPEHLYDKGVSPQDAALRIGPRYVVPEGRGNPRSFIPGRDDPFYTGEVFKERGKWWFWGQHPDKPGSKIKWGGYSSKRLALEMRDG